MRSIVFDLDGTLADTSGDLVAAANYCFRDMGAGDQLTVADAGTALRGGRAMLLLGLERMGRPADEALVARYYQVLLDAYEAEIDTHSVFYPGALDAVAALAGADFKVAVCTNKPEYLARQLMQKMGALDLFGALIGADTLPVRKPDPEPLREAVRRAGGDPARALMVGDTITDHDTARAAGVPSVLVTFGPNGGDMPALAPDALLHDYSELPEIAERLLA
ncbi:phosphoglycolate phosphatase [Roseovarius nanhaiticus]|uniref:phosphoglycolate phosphatase n=1 Tax=Roseovarius nanhaiticus TaxID=573024 RepID=A0A1N7HEB9_9RHOB|nr:HAD-IA family hydrolase [Roseovarius nanhaiticus]SEK99771.1 phosphoglycolate phosphatase [Roseovarius nanhaiticus]SIS23209.1 phosphoglycolate phosphatase [Roseovarius nanhaiticus]